MERKCRTHINQLLQVIEENRRTNEKRIDEPKERTRELETQIINNKN